MGYKSYNTFSVKYYMLIVIDVEGWFCVIAWTWRVLIP